MKFIKNLMPASLFIAAAFTLSACAAGAATSGYALKAQSADSLTATAEQKIVDRVKREMLYETATPCITR